MNLKSSYVKSIDGYLIEYRLGYEIDNLFTGIIISNKTIFHIQNNEIYFGHHPDEDLVEKDSFWEEIFKQYHKDRLFSFGLVSEETIDKHLIVMVEAQTNNLLMLSDKNTENTYSIPTENLLKGYIPTSDHLVQEIFNNKAIEYNIMRLEQFISQCKGINSNDVMIELDNLLERHGLRRDPMV